MVRATLVLLLAFALAACGGAESNEEDLPFTTLQSARDAIGAVPRGTYVVRSQQELATTIATNQTGFLMGAPGRFPPVDYSQSVVIGVLSGLGNSCLSHEIVGVHRSDRIVTVQHRRVEPASGTGRGCGPDVVPTSVWALIATTSAAVQFEELAVRYY